jgi:DNA modification methylase
LLLVGDVRQKIKEIDYHSVQTIVTSPPYWGLRDYDESNQIGQEKTPEDFISHILCLSYDFMRVLKDDGIFWLNLGDTYFGAKGGHWSSDNSFTNDTTGTKYREHRKAPPKHSYLKTKDLTGVPWKTAIALQKEGWYLRNDIIWSKNNPMPEAVKDRFAKSHEHIFMFTKQPHYYFDYEAVLEPYTEPLNRWGGDNYNDVEESKYKGDMAKSLGYSHQDHKSGKGKAVRPNPNGKTRKDVWKLNTSSYKGGHFAVFPAEIPELCIKASTRKGDTVLDPFMGSGTTAVVAKRLERKWIGIELNPEYAQIINDRTRQTELF